MATPEEKQEVVDVEIEDVNSAGKGEAVEKHTAAPAADPTAERAGISAEVVPKSKGIKVVDRSGMKQEGLPKDTGAMVRLVSDVMEKNKDKNKDSPVYNAINGALYLYSKYFGFAMTPGSFSMYIDTKFFNENFDQKQTERIIVGILKKQISFLSKKHKKKTTKPDEKKRILVTMDKLAKRLYGLEFEVIEGEDEEAYVERIIGEADVKALEYEQTDLEGLTEAELDKFAKIDDADPYISAYYVGKKIGSLKTGVPEGDIVKKHDPEALFAFLDTEYDDSSLGTDGTRQSLFELEDSSSEFLTQLHSGDLPAGSVVFFDQAQSGSADIKTMCGIVGMDRKIRMQTKNGLEVVTDFDAAGNKLMGALEDFAKTGDVKKDLDITKELKEKIYRRFKGVFIPNTEKGGEIPKEEPKEKDQSGEESTGESGAEAILRKKADEAKADEKAAETKDTSEEEGEPVAEEAKKTEPEPKADAETDKETTETTPAPSDEPKVEAAPAAEVEPEPEPEAIEEPKGEKK